MAYETILVEKKDGIGKITLNRPEVLNAINMQMLADLDQAFTEMEEADDVQVIIITGAGRAFSAGRDLKQIGAATHRPGGSIYARSETSSKPVIAAVNGYCYTGAFEMVLCTDMIVASDKAVFADTHARYGLVGAGGLTQRLAKIVGPRKAKEISLTCEPVSAAEAERIGLVNKVVPADQLDEAATELAKKIMKNNQQSVQTVKYLINQGLKWGIAVGLELETREWQRRHKEKAGRRTKEQEAFLSKEGKK
jgi:enoyl-CoA hydratase/carnithine racemase